MDPNTAENLAKQRQQYGQRLADIPNQFNPATDPTVNALRGQQSEKLKQLFAYDQQLADTNFKPVATPAGPGEVVPESAPRLVDPTIGLRASSTQTQATAKEVGDIVNEIAKRKDSLSFEREKAYATLDRLIDLNDKEQRALEKRLDRELEERKSREGASNGAAELTALLQSITGAQKKKAATTPAKSGVTKADLSKIRQFGTLDSKSGIWTPTEKAGSGWRKFFSEINSGGGGTLDYTKNKNGSYNWAVRKPDQEFFESEEEAEPYRDFPALLKKLGATTKAVNPKLDTEVNSLIKDFLPEDSNVPQYQSKEASRQILRQNITNMPKTIDRDTALRTLIVNHPELTADEILAELDAFGI